MEEMIRFIVFKNISEANAESMEGLCFYFANNIKADLEMMDIDAYIYNINDGNGYNHYYLIAENFLIDPTYSQFLPKENEKTISFEDFPANILVKNEKGKGILNDLLENGFHKLKDGDLDIYLSSFKFKEGKVRK